MSGATTKGSRSADVGSNAHVTVAKTFVYDVHKFYYNEEKVSLRCLSLC